MKKIILPAILLSTITLIFLFVNNDASSDQLTIQKTIPAFDKANWEQNVLTNISASEYHFSRITDGNYSAVNRNNNARFVISPDGFITNNRISGDVPVAIQIEKIITGEKIFTPTAETEVNCFENSLQYVYPNITIEYLNSDAGLRQNFIIASQPKSAKSAEVILSIDKKYESHLENNILTLQNNGEVIQQYSDLKAFDANGKNLDAEMLLAENILTLHVNTADAVFPVVIDPLTTTPVWSAESNQEGGNMGFSVSTAGDVNNDGYDDVVVGAAAYDAGQVNEGKVFLYLGSAAGLSSTPVWEDEGDNTGGLMGKSVANAGDVNGDGYDDLLIAIGEYSGPEVMEGKAQLYYGNAGGVSVEPDWTFEANQAGAILGFPLDGLGDVNNDGYDDIIIGLNGYDNGQEDEGVVYAFYGSASGLASTPDWQIESNQAEARLGHAACAAGDVNNDGYNDALVGAYNYNGAVATGGKAWVYLGGPGGLSTTPVWEMEGDQSNAYYAFWTSGMGDVNGDGYDDIVVGAKRYDEVYTDEGKAWLYYGSASGPLTTAAWTGRGDNDGAEYANQFGEAGDVNNDGYDDMIMGSHYHTQSFLKEGAAYLYLGSATGLSTTYDWVYYGNQAQANMGWAVDGAGDVNNDGNDDVIISAFKYSNPEASEGKAFVFHGISSCGIPVGYSVSSITPTTALASWTGSADATNYKIIARRTGQTLVFITTASPYSLTGLTPAKKYKSYVQAKCGTTWTLRSNVVTFTTPPMRIADQQTEDVVYPNPANQWITINPANITGNAIIRIFTTDGQELLAYNYNSDENANGIYIDLSGFSSGYYFYTVQTEGEIKTGAFVKR